MSYRGSVRLRQCDAKGDSIELLSTILGMHVLRATSCSTAETVMLEEEHEALLYGV